MASKQKFSAPPPPAPPMPIARTLKYGESTEHLVRRLGSALVLQWDALPDNLQDLIIDQAAIVEDRSEAGHTPGDIEAFLRKAKSVALGSGSLAIVAGTLPK
jgi:hypothetical protein